MQITFSNEKTKLLVPSRFYFFGQIRLITILYKSEKHIENILKSTKHVEKQ